MIKTDNILGAAEVVKTSNALANICGKVCPEEIYCQSVCNRAKQDSPIQIRELHFFATQHESERGYSKLLKFPKLKSKVAIVGSGPAGISCAFELSKFGYEVTIFGRDALGGVPKQSIPAFRLSDRELSDDFRFLSKHFKFKRTEINSGDLGSLTKKNDAVFLGIGLGEDRNIGVSGEGLAGVVSVLDFLEAAKKKSKRVHIGQRVVVVGGGNVSLDAAATAKRLGAKEVILIYRRSEKEMKVWKSELEEARAQGVEIRFLTSPVEIVGKRSVNGIICRRNRLSSQKDSSGRPIPVEVKGSEHLLKADLVIVAIGQVLPKQAFEKIKRNSSGFIKVDRNCQTSMPGVFAGGDAISGEGTIVQSVAHGKGAAHAIHKYLSNK